MGPDEDSTLPAEDRESGQSAGRRPRTRCCLLKGFERRFCPQRAGQHYCSDECRRAARQWSRWKAQQSYRATAAGKERRNGQSRRYRERVRNRPTAAPEEADPDAARVITHHFFRLLLRFAYWRLEAWLELLRSALNGTHKRGTVRRKNLEPARDWALKIVSGAGRRGPLWQSQKRPRCQ